MKEKFHVENMTDGCKFCPLLSIGRDEPIRCSSGCAWYLPNRCAVAILAVEAVEAIDMVAGDGFGG